MKTTPRYFDLFTLYLPTDAISECSGPGQKDEAVNYWVNKVFNLKANAAITVEALRLTLREYGAWDEAELRDHNENERRIVWIAACDLREEQNARGGK